MKAKLLFERKKYLITFIAGCIIGAVCFLMIYGFAIINPLYDDWLFLGDMDLRQHYIGFCHFRQSRWQFPIGLIETLSYPVKMSVIYTDSIPLLAVIFKFFSAILPVRFQYFGLFGLCSFMLMGGFSSLLLMRFIGRPQLCLLGSVFFIISFPVIQRTFYHTALGAQWIIIAALDIWLYQENFRERSRIVLWGLMGFVIVGIHSYFLPMAGIVLLGALADQYIVIRKKEGSLIKEGMKKKLMPLLGQLFAYCIMALINLYILGGFYGSTSAVGPGLGSFGSNLNTFINPLSDGKFYGPLPLYYDFQYEGFGYLGFGVILMLVFAVVALFILNLKGIIEVKKLLKEHYRIYIAMGIFLLSFGLAVLPMVTFNDKKLFGLPLPGLIRDAFSIFRSNGRFIWPGVYLLILLAIVAVYKLFYSCMEKTVKEREGIRGQTGFIVMAIALLIQLYDISYMLSYKNEYFSREQSYENIWMEKELPFDINKYSGFIFMYNENDIIMDTAFFAYLKGMWQNNYYYARDIDALVSDDIAKWEHELKNNIIRPDLIYIFKEEDFDPKLYEGLEGSDIIPGHIIARMKE
ncbi:MAG: DUF6311 domain-containing protein [Lachnospiraceae bacterium]|nr:DUF6311 domain-containing protein [Lachnospiraceae bacterium]